MSVISAIGVNYSQLGIQSSLSGATLTNKATPVTSDILIIQDSESANALKEISIAQALALASGGGDCVKITAGSVSGGLLTVTNLSSAFRKYVLTVSQMVSSVGAALLMQFSNDNGSNWGTQYGTIWTELNTSGVANDTVVSTPRAWTNSHTEIKLQVYTGVASGYWQTSGDITIIDPMNASTMTGVSFDLCRQDGFFPQMVASIGRGVVGEAAATNAFKLYGETGNLSFNYTLYGYTA